jgi:hypothetical protein
MASLTFIDKMSDDKNCTGYLNANKKDTNFRH